MWDAIIDHLLDQNLHGPAGPFSASTGRPNGPQSSSSGPRTPSTNPDPSDWILVDESGEKDMDAKDPRWLVLFIQYFLELDSNNDDLLFFVRDPDEIPDEPNAEPVFVRRKVGKSMPQMTDPVDWKQTFFLNLIIQLPCTLTVAVCKRIPANSSSSQMTGGTKTRTLAKTEERVVVVDKGTELVERGRPNDVQRSGSPDGAESGTDDKITNGTRTSTKPSSSRDSNKSRMVALRRITKKVYAAPYKSRMDVKDAFMNELSYPLIFYTVNDYESHDLHLPIWEREYLCVELSVNAPLDPAAASALNHEGAVAAVSIEDDPSPFPIPRGYFKVVLFQGAVPYSSLLDIFQQKGLASQNQRRNRSGGGGGGGGGGFGGGFGGGGGGGERTEYIMMRGPHGKGQCQVAIQDHSNAAGAGAGGGADGGSGSAGSSGFSTSPGRGMTLSDRLRFLGDTVRAGINAVTGATSPTSSSGSLDSLTTTPRKPDSLRCSMTYVNVPWQSIISDLIDHAKSKRNPGSAKQDSGTPASP